jgi:DNA polymerase III epsilon subunit-like protein
MNEIEWILLDTETTGFARPVYVVELAAQRMCGWQRSGQPFRRLLNHGADIPPEVARVHGYTREILERDGESPIDVYKGFAEYAGERFLVAYNLSYDLDQVLLPEWSRLGVSPMGHPGFCALALAQRLLDPVPAGNCKLQTLRQYYRLPERGAHTALGDVDTVIDLINGVLRPLALDRGLETWDDLVSFSQSEWFPSRIAFGKHKGRDFRDARDDDDLMEWLGWLSSSTNKLSSAMGKRYLSELGRVEIHTASGPIMTCGTSQRSACLGAAGRSMTSSTSSVTRA